MKQKNRTPPEKTHQRNIIQVPTTQLAKMSIDPKFVSLAADVLKIFLILQDIPYKTLEMKQKNRPRLGFLFWGGCVLQQSFNLGVSAAGFLVFLSMQACRSSTWLPCFLLMSRLPVPYNSRTPTIQNPCRENERRKPGWD